MAATKARFAGRNFYPLCDTGCGFHPRSTGWRNRLKNNFLYLSPVRGEFFFNRKLTAHPSGRYSNGCTQQHSRRKRTGKNAGLRPARTGCLLAAQQEAQMNTMKESLTEKVDLEAELQPENELEYRLLQIPSFRRGLFWGVPRYGHPEGAVYKHIKEVLENIDRLQIEEPVRRRLRLIAFVHDTFKYREEKNPPPGAPSRHHAVLARQFLSGYIDDEIVLDIVELHDEAYYCWRTIYLFHQPEAGEKRLQELLHRIRHALQSYYLFFKCDTLTGDKTPAPLHWFERTVDGIDFISL